MAVLLKNLKTALDQAQMLTTGLKHPTAKAGAKASAKAEVKAEAKAEAKPEQKSKCRAQTPFATRWNEEII